MSKNLSHLSGRKGLSNNLFEKIGALSEETGTVDPEALQTLAKEYLMTPSQVFGATSFYDFTRPENKGKQVYLCNGSACQLAGTQNTLRKKIEKYISPEAIGEMCCLGRCHENNAFQYEEVNYSGQDAHFLEEILKNGSGTARPDKYRVNSMGKAVLCGLRILWRLFPGVPHSGHL